MFKILFLLSFSFSFVFSEYDIKCPNEIQYSSGSGNIGVDYFYYTGDVDYPESPWYGVFFEAWDSQSAVCGGDLDKNILLMYSCSYDSGICFDHVKTSSLNGFHIIDYAYNEENIIINGTYTNNTIIVDHIPCVNISNLSYGTNIIHTYYNDDTSTKDINSDFMGFPITGLFDTTEYILDEEDAKSYRKKCNKTDIVEYVDDLEPQRFHISSILSNLNNFFHTQIDSINYNLSSINNINITSEDYSSVSTPTETDITGDLDNFTNDYESTLDTAYSNYTDVFGFGGYGSAPDDVSFTFNGQNIVLFSESHYSESIDTVRNTLLTFSYVIGTLLVLKGEKSV